MKKSPFKFASPVPTNTESEKALVKVYVDAGHSLDDARRMAARDVERGKLKWAKPVEKSVGTGGLFQQADVRK